MNNQTMEVKEVIVATDALAHGGEAVGSVISASDETLIGKRVFVPFVVPGEKVKAALRKNKSSYSTADLIEIITPSPDRVTPPCPYFTECGGCTLQHIAPDKQRQLKLEMATSQISIHGQVELEKETTLIGKELPYFHYRRRVILHLRKDGQLGFYAAGVKYIVPIKQCLIMVEQINAILPQLTDALANYTYEFGDIVLEHCEGELFAEFRVRPPVTPESDKFIPLVEQVKKFIPNLIVSHHHKPLHIVQRGEKSDSLHYPVGHFAQVNAQGNAILQQKVIELCPANSRITEFHAGAGNFTFPLARAGNFVTAIEVDAALVAEGNKQAELQGLADKIQFIQRSAEKYVKKHPLSGVILLDPPRSGAKEVVEVMNPDQVSRVIYVSCHLPSLIRDLSILNKKGFTIKETMVLDMFSQTYHAETITVIEGIQP